MERISGVLMHPTSLPGPYGIGDLGPEAHRFVDWLSDAGQGVWQVLPLGPTGYGDSPYAPFSSFAGNELLISPAALVSEGFLPADFSFPIFPAASVDYGKVLAWKLPLLEQAAEAFLDRAPPEQLMVFEDFKRVEAGWLDDYVLFRSIKAVYDAKAVKEGAPNSLWNEYWQKGLALRDRAALTVWKRDHARDLARREVLQFFFFEQWEALKKHAHNKGVRLFGDLPVFVAQDSSDVWAHRELFDLDARGNPREVAGVPPDYFSEDGQLWGNPLYNWAEHEQEGFRWWISRIRAALRTADFVRIDHFRGFVAYWSIPAGARTARKGVWRKAPGHALFAAVLNALGGEIPILAEDLGFITDEVRDLRDRYKLPGMKILQFGFDARESGEGLDPRNDFLPHNYPTNCAVYTGTHDNDTLKGWLDKITPEELEFLRDYMGDPKGDLVRAMVREAWKSVARLALAPLQDLLGLGSEARMNTPATLGGNWTWRLASDVLDARLAGELAEMTRIYGRNLK
jgi:4-alpha-glucanotransferase